MRTYKTCSGYNVTPPSYRRTMATVDWGQLHREIGDWVCPDHGIIRPDMTTIVPSCREPADSGGPCLRAAERTTQDRRGYLVGVTPAPSVCGGPDEHRSPSLSWQWRGCRCTTTKGHHVWLCRQCRAVQAWPPIGVNPGCEAQRD